LVRRLPIGIPATTRVSLTSPLIARIATGGACAVRTFTSILLRCVVKTQTQPDPLAFHVDIEDLHAHHLTGPHDLMRVGHKAIGHRGDVHEAVLMHTNVNEGAERRDVGDYTLQDHADL
jgi:hypothetical protein